jgi:hypothetical protein
MPPWTGTGTWPSRSGGFARNWLAGDTSVAFPQTMLIDYIRLYEPAARPA